MQFKTVIYGVARLLQVMGLVMILPTIIAWFDQGDKSASATFVSPEFSGFWIAILLSLAAGTFASWRLKKYKTAQTVREGFAIVTLGWVVLTIFGALPFFIYFLESEPALTAGGIAHAFTDACFEIMSGFSTTGATILTDIEALPRGLLFWRSFTHWLGGMGIVTLALVIFPALGVSGYHMFKGEVPGPTTERFQPRLAQTATILWGVYATLSGAETILLMLGGMDWFDALCHTFGTMATGGFSTKNLSVGHYSSEFIHWTITIFMFFAGMNFLLHYNLLRGKVSILKADREFRFYVYVIAGAIAIATVTLYFGGLPDADYARTSYRHEHAPIEDFHMHVEHEAGKISTLYGSFKQAAFQVISITTTTGYGTADFDLWPALLQFLLVALMFFGGCAGSTGGGMKMIRIFITVKAALREIVRMARPRIIKPIMVGPTRIEEVRVSNIVSFFILFVLLFAGSSMLMTLFVPDLVTACTSVVACLANIGPGLSGVGSVENYHWIPLPGKWILIGNMLLGRLEIFTVLIILRPSIWR